MEAEHNFRQELPTEVWSTSLRWLRLGWIVVRENGWFLLCIKRKLPEVNGIAYLNKMGYID